MIFAVLGVVYKMNFSAIALTLLAATLLLGCLQSGQNSASTPTPTETGGVLGYGTSTPSATPAPTATNTPETSSADQELNQALEEGSLDSQANDNSSQELTQVLG